MVGESKLAMADSSATSIDHEGCLHILRCTALSTVHEMADDPQPNTIRLISRTFGFRIAGDVAGICITRAVG